MDIDTQKLIKLDQGNVKQSYEEWIYELADWKIFLTLTFKKDTSDFASMHAWRGLVQELNRRLIGDHYTKKVKHSYFGYVLAKEYQIREVIHFHAILDKPIDFNILHGWWNARYGFAWSRIIKQGTKQDTIRYITKYIMKDGIQGVTVYKPRISYIPENKPAWWL